MSLKDDFLEALRSVKKDFVKDYDYNEPAQEQPTWQEAAPVDQQPVQRPAPPPPPAAGARMSDEEVDQVLHERSPSILDNFQPELHTPAEPGTPEKKETPEPEEDKSFFQEIEAASAEAEEESEGEREDAPVFEPVMAADAFDQAKEEDSDAAGVDADNTSLEGGGGRFSLDSFDLGESFGDERTIISKNTVIRGALQTDDSVRMFGQVLGDIDCRSNILVAGKVRGNTSAANAYIINAQVDGNLLCDDVINVTDDAWILGNIRAQQADIDGKIKGNIEIRHSISIGSNSSVIGNISTDELEIRRGAFVNGQIMMYSPSRDVIDRFDRFDQ